MCYLKCLFPSDNLQSWCGGRSHLFSSSSCAGSLCSRADPDKHSHQCTCDVEAPLHFSWFCFFFSFFFGFLSITFSFVPFSLPFIFPFCLTFGLFRSGRETEGEGAGGEKPFHFFPCFSFFLSLFHFSPHVRQGQLSQDERVEMDRLYSCCVWECCDGIASRTARVCVSCRVVSLLILFCISLVTTFSLFLVLVCLFFLKNKTFFFRSRFLLFCCLFSFLRRFTIVFPLLFQSGSLHFLPSPV